MGLPNAHTQWALSLGINFMTLSLCLTAASKLVAFRLHNRLIFRIVWLDICVLLAVNIQVIMTIAGLLNENDVQQYEYMIAAYISMESLSLFLGIIESTDRFCALILKSKNRKIIKASVWTFFGTCFLFILLSEFIGIWVIYHGFFNYASTPYYVNILNPFLSFYYNAYILTASFMDLHFLTKLVQGIGIRLDTLPEGKEKFIVHNHVIWIIFCLVTSAIAFCINIAAAVTGSFTFSDHLNGLTHAYRLNVFIDFGVHIRDLLSSDYIRGASNTDRRKAGSQKSNESEVIAAPPGKSLDALVVI
ncbi:uncharacterized protein BJ171DRAFT_470721 [Polychytrium aggregatum]|uniref:uncharacterized protein n=1 Tax=Polychytrium aggregatum TaxID=110093 RepID=UPI0022FDC5A3|nr:uncharacterized protein BJ171DRAFT_470721 [Polychytrium aggregatum]KAI9209785.1 hypothetical protein BJ171DRAFT_470721 [Polychytrium aggregatum]